MQTITLDISDDELLEVTRAYQVLQKFLDKIVSPNDLYFEQFLEGLEEARGQVQKKDYSEVKEFADFVQ